MMHRSMKLFPCADAAAPPGGTGSRRPRPHRAPLAVLLLVLLPTFGAIGCEAAGGAPAQGDVAIVNGRVIDPESGVDSVLNVVVRDDRIAAVTAEEVDAEHVIDADGLVVAPGFVDILAAMRPDRTPQRHKIRDGVTSTVDMHGGPVDVDGWYGRFEDEGSLVNYGVTIGHPEMRTAAGVTDRYAAASPEQLDEMRTLAAEGLEAGAVGIGFGINYTPGAPYTEILAMFEVAAEYGVPGHAHSRHKGSVFPGDIVLSVMELINAAAVTGAQVQVVHLASSAIGSMRHALRMIDGARANGIDIMADMHVYRGNRTSIESALYDEGWEERHGGVTVDSVYIPELGRRLRTEAEFREWRERGGPVTVFHIPRDEIEMALRSPHMMITSDGVAVSETSHPRGAGTFARTLGRFVREDGVLTLHEALEKMTVLPARRLEAAVPGMGDRGRLREGAFADVTVFDPGTIIDRATYDDGLRYSEGVHHVLVNGTVVLEDAAFVEGAAPGRPIRRPETEADGEDGG